MARAKRAALVTIFVCLTLTSIFGLYYTHQLPLEEERVTTSCTYRHTTAYNYTAKLSPNKIYNQSTLKPGEGILYRRITEHINVTLTYTFQCTQPANGSIRHNSTTELASPGMWTKKLTKSPSNTVNFTGNTGNFSIALLINTTQIEDIGRSIDNEIGTHSSTYNLTVKPEIHIIAQTEAGIINEPFNPPLVIIFTYATAKGDYISIDNLLQTSTGTIEQTKRVFLQSTMDQRYFSYIMSLPSFIGLALTTWAYTKAKPKKPEEPLIDEIISPHEEIIVDVAGEPSYKGQRATVAMKSLEDLVNLADGLAKPVFHLEKPQKPQGKKPTHIFYVLDGSTRFEYRITTPSLVERETKAQTILEDENQDN